MAFFTDRILPVADGTNRLSPGPGSKDTQAHDPSEGIQDHDPCEGDLFEGIQAHDPYEGAQIMIREGIFMFPLPVRRQC